MSLIPPYDIKRLPFPPLSNAHFARARRASRIVVIAGLTLRILMSLLTMRSNPTSIHCQENIRQLETTHTRYSFI